MSRALGADPTEATPYRNLWDAADPDITSTDVNQAPVQIPTNELMGQTMLTISCGSDVDDVNPEWHLIAADLNLGALGPADVVMAVMPVQTSPPATGREQQLDGVGGIFVHSPAQFDLRSIVRTRKWSYYLALAVLPAGATTVYLIDYWTTSKPL
jgi:hypothetical protein